MSSCPISTRVLNQFSADDQKFSHEAEETGGPKNWNTSEFCTVPEEVPSIQLKLGPWREQGERTWCFAEVAADLATYTVGRYVSAASMAIYANYYKFSMNKVMRPDMPVDIFNIYTEDNGRVNDAINGTLAMVGTFCSSDSFLDKAIKTLPVAQFREYLRAIQLAAQTKHISPQADVALRELFGSTRKLKNLLLKNSPDTSIYSLTESICQNSKISASDSFDFGYIHGIGSIAHEGMLNIIAKELKSGRPVGVNFNIFDFLKSPPDQPSKLKSIRDSNINFRNEESKPECSSAFNRIYEKLGNKPLAGHAVTAVGLVYNFETRRCMMRLRNSWGGSCNSLRTDKVKCELETILIPVDDLVYNLESIHTIIPATKK
jgi:hypothetical protein